MERRMTEPKQGAANGGEWPRRIWLGESCDEWSLSPSEYNMEYISLEEHQYLLNEAARAARAQAFEECEVGLCTAHGFAQIRRYCRTKAKEARGE